MISHDRLLAWTHRARPIGTAIAIGLFLANSAKAQTVFTVDSALDQIDDNTSDGICHTAAGTCTLRAAVMQANQIGNAGASIMLPAGTYPLTRPPVGADGDDSGDLNLTAPANAASVITITGASAATTIIDANKIDRVFSIASTRVAIISGVTLRNGFAASANGGGISNAGDLTLRDSIVSENAATGTAGIGGGIFSASGGRLTMSSVTVDSNSAYLGGGVGAYGSTPVSLNDCTLTNNSAIAGGGIYVSTGNVTIAFSKVIGNTATYGGGIYKFGSPFADPGSLGLLMLDHDVLSGNQAQSGGGINNEGLMHAIRSTLSSNAATTGGGLFNGGSARLSNVTISQNNATGNGGGIWNGTGAPGATTIENSTIVFNQADSDFDSQGGGAGIFNFVGYRVDLYNSVVAGNVVQVDHAFEDCQGVVNSHGHNRYSDAADANMSYCTVAQMDSGNFLALNSMNELGDLQDNGGPTKTHALIAPSDMIDGADPSMGCGELGTDQRDMPRVVGASCDIGAYEYNDAIFSNGFD